jgi:hypothetical protein
MCFFKLENEFCLQTLEERIVVLQKKVDLQIYSAKLVHILKFEGIILLVRNKNKGKEIEEIFP